MFVTVYDAPRLILFALHTGEALTEQELEGLVAAIRKLAADGTARQLPTTALTIVETGNTLNAVQRKRLAAEVSGLRRGCHAVVTDSVLARTAMTAIRWLTPSTDGFEESTHAKYEEARAWLVERTGHPASVLDALLAQVRAQVGKGERSVERGFSP
jgi:hypothetical protein